MLQRQGAVCPLVVQDLRTQRGHVVQEKQPVVRVVALVLSSVYSCNSVPFTSTAVSALL